jgi:hypothetical protein
LHPLKEKSDILKSFIPTANQIKNKEFEKIFEAENIPANTTAESFSECRA